MKGYKYVSAGVLKCERDWVCKKFVAFNVDCPVRGHSVDTAFGRNSSQCLSRSEGPTNPAAKRSDSGLSITSLRLLRCRLHAMYMHQLGQREGEEVTTNALLVKTGLS